MQGLYLLTQLYRDYHRVHCSIDVSCASVQILGLAEYRFCRKFGREITKSTADFCGFSIFPYQLVLWSSSGHNVPLYSGYSVAKSDIHCRIWCHLFVDTTRLRCAFAQLVMVRSHFQSKSDIVSIGWKISDTTGSFPLLSYPKQPVYAAIDLKAMVSQKAYTVTPKSRNNCFGRLVKLNEKVI